MPIYDHLTLHLFRLKPAEAWGNLGEGLHFVLLHTGAGEHFNGSCTQPAILPLAPGDILVFSAGTGGTLRATARVELVFWAFHVCLEHLFPLFTANEIPVVQHLLDAFKTAHVYRAAAPATASWNRLIRNAPPEFSLEHRSQLLRMVAAVLSEEFRRIRPSDMHGPRPDERIVHLFEQLSIGDILSLSVDELAGRFSCSRRHLNRIFHQHFGLSVGALRMEMRLLKAVSLLRNPDSKIITLAEQCGFNHLGLFNACFKRRFGVSPGQWRKHLGEMNGPTPILPAGDSRCRMRANGLCPWLDAAARQKTVFGNQNTEVHGQPPRVRGEQLVVVSPS